MNNSSPRPLTRPRHYAALIVQAAGDVALQRQIFEACPFEMRAQVRDLTKLGLFKAEHLLKHQELIQSARDKAPTHQQAPRASSRSKSNREFGQQQLAQLRTAAKGAA